MTKYNKEDYIKYRLEKADETLIAAQVLLQNKLWNSVVNRLYYACFSDFYDFEEETAVFLYDQSVELIEKVKALIN